MMPAEHSVLIVVTSAGLMPTGKVTGVWLEEFALPYMIFRREHMAVVVASPKGGPVPIDPRSAPNNEQAKDWLEATSLLQHTVPLSVVDPAAHDGIFIPGGHGAMFDLPQEGSLDRILGQFDSDGKVIGSVCHGPAAFVGARRSDGRAFIHGRRFTCFSDHEEAALGLTNDVPFLLQQRLEEQGGKFDGGIVFLPSVVVDDNLITGQNPASAGEAAERFVEVLQRKPTKPMPLA